MYSYVVVCGLICSYLALCVSGILLMMSLCEEVHVYEYIPSLRQTDLCHYHERYFDAACTLGAYHPLLYEKMLIQRMNVGSEEDLKRKGKVTLPGFKNVHCEPWTERRNNRLCKAEEICRLTQDHAEPALNGPCYVDYGWCSAGQNLLL